MEKIIDFFGPRNRFGPLLIVVILLMAALLSGCNTNNGFPRFDTNNGLPRLHPVIDRVTGATPNIDGVAMVKEVWKTILFPSYSKKNSPASVEEIEEVLQKTAMNAVIWAELSPFCKEFRKKVRAKRVFDCWQKIATHHRVVFRDDINLVIFDQPEWEKTRNKVTVAVSFRVFRNGEKALFALELAFEGSGTLMSETKSRFLYKDLRYARRAY